METFGGRLKRIREARGLTQAQVTELAQLGKSALTQYERDVLVPGEDVLERIGRVLETHPAVLRYGEEVLRVAASAEAQAALRRVAYPAVA